MVAKVALASELGDSVGGEGILRMILCGRDLPLLSVDRSTGRGEDHIADPILDAVFEEAHGTQRVHFRNEVRSRMERLTSI